MLPSCRLLVVALALCVGCGSKKDFSPLDGATDNDGGTDDDSSIITNPPDAAVGIVVKPALAQLTASGSPVTQQFDAFDVVTNAPVTPTWSIDNVALGSIDSNGLFTAVGTVGGVSAINAELGGSLGKATVEVNVTLMENPGNVSNGDQGLLKGGGNADAGFKWLYPYDKTVMLRGLQPAVMQFGGAPASALYVHITAKHVDYSGFFGASNPSQATLSPTMWNAILQSVGASDPMKVEVTKLTGGQVTGPKTETWEIAQGTARGTVYYNTYSSGGAMFKLKVGQNAVQLLGQCKVCHSASASGNVLASTDGTYDLKNNAAPLVTSGSRQYAFAGVYPDGTFLLTSYTTSPGSAGTNPAELRNAATGVKIAAPGMDGSGIMPAMPAFSDDGKKLVFNAGNSKTLSVMDFDVKTKTFSKKVDILTTTTTWPSWPQFTPDALWVLYHDDTKSEFGTRSGAKANIKMVEVATKKVVSLDSLNGMLGNTPYMPYGAAEIDMNYEPTLLPLAVGGYYWVVFTSRRCYGNILTPTSDPDPFAYGTARRKKLWLSALDIAPKANTDPSHPAIYVPGQDLTPGNMRAFWSLDPCKANGQTCTSADECCGGFCRQSGNQKVCIPPPGGCSQEFETCTVDTDCCGNSAGVTCIAGHCATPKPN